MGNRAIITTDGGKIGLYLHWNGGRDSVEGFLKYCELKGYSSPDRDGYGWARLAQVVGNFFGGSSSVGIEEVTGDADIDSPGDNGIYIIKGWQIVGRRDFDGVEQNEYPLDEMLVCIDERQPAGEQFGEYLTAPEVKPEELKTGDYILYLDELDGTVKTGKIIGIGKPGKVVNGSDVGGVPYIDRFGTAAPENNINNYIRETVRRGSAPEEVKPEEPAPAAAVKVSYNTEFNGIEISFPGKPDAETRGKLKSAGFRWHNTKKVWYARRTADREKIAEELMNGAA